MSLFPKGIIQGMGVTAKNFFQSYYKKDRLPTVEYPEEKSTVNQYSRNFPFLLYDGDDPIEGMRCIACTLCELACPPACIYIIKDKDENGKPIKRPVVFDIDLSVCMSCQLCVEACPYEAIRMDSEFELSTANRFEGLMVNREELLKSNEYYHEIHPIEAQVTDDRMAAKAAEAAAKQKEREERARLAAEAKKAAEEKKVAEEAATAQAAESTEATVAETAEATEPEVEKIAPVAESPQAEEQQEVPAAPETAEAPKPVEEPPQAVEVNEVPNGKEAAPKLEKQPNRPEDSAASEEPEVESDNSGEPEKPE
jgi:NADH-quinone oxidoreductase subunit I